jgi:hypothetical protein
MAKQTISLGAAPTGVGGDTPRTAFVKTQANIDELYAALGATGSPSAIPTALPVLQGGTGARSTDAAPFPTKAASGVGTIAAPDAWGYDNPGNVQGGGFYKVGGGSSSSGMTYAALIRAPYAPNYEAQIYFPMGSTANKMYFRCALGNSGGTFGAAQEIYHTGNTTRAADGTLKAI